MLEAAGATLEVAAPASTGADSSVQADNSAEESNQLTGTEGEGGTGTGAEETEAQPVAGAKFDARAVIKDPSKLAALKAVDPALVGFVRDAVFSQRELEKAGGLKTLIESHKFAQEVGGRDGWQATKDDLASWDQLDKDFSEGKPEFVERIAKGDPEAFERMVPLALQQIGKSNPEMYSHLMSRVIINTMDQAGLTNALKGLLGTAGDTAKPIIQEIIDWAEGFRATASKVPEKKVDAREQKLTEREQEFSNKQAQMLVRSVDSDSIKHRDSIIAREIKPFGDWDTMDADRRGAVAAWISQRIGKTLSADSRFMERRNTLIANGDRDGLAKLEQAKLDELAPKLVPQAAKVFGVTKAAAKAAQAAKPGQTATVKAPQGWVQLKGRIDMSMVDRTKTDSNMLMDNKAVYKDGRKVLGAAA
jgi:hypothetical protein